MFCFSCSSTKTESVSDEKSDVNVKEETTKENKSLFIEDAEPLLPELSSEINIQRNERIVNLKELLDEYIDKHEDLKEFEKELKKHKDEITPGTIGEA